MDAHAREYKTKPMDGVVRVFGGRECKNEANRWLGVGFVSVHLRPFAALFRFEANRAPDFDAPDAGPT